MRFHFFSHNIDEAKKNSHIILASIFYIGGKNMSTEKNLREENLSLLRNISEKRLLFSIITGIGELFI